MPNSFRSVTLSVSLLVVACSSEPPSEKMAESQQSIAGGVEDSGALAHPAVVMLVHNNGACTGSLIAPKLVLTARHCVSQNLQEGIGCDIYGNSSNGDHVGADYPASAFKIYTGVTPNFGSPVATGTQLFHPPGAVVCNNDIALIVLNQAVTGVTPLPVRLDWGPQIGELTTAVGYGAINDFQQGSGKRRRRANVPVLTAGQDWNHVTGAGELAVGQAACSGDSGGPVISPAGSVIGVASRVANCSDPNTSAKYVRLDYHKALILQAFAAAGASPKLDPGPAPPPITKHAVGEGPCKTGAECVSAICQTNGGYCTDFCGNLPCSSSTTYCTETTVDISGQSIQEKFCVPLPAGTPCEQCRSKECVNLTSVCLQNASCKALLTCVDACADEACHDACVAQHPGAQDDYLALENCACASSCQSVCSHQCFAEPGTGGSAGTGAGGGGGMGSTTNMGGSAGVGGAAAGAAGLALGDGGLEARNREVQGCALASGTPAGSRGFAVWLSALGAVALTRRRRRRA